jgi:hypothetical protein
MKYIITYNFNDCKKNKSFNNWYEAMKAYCQISSSILYSNIKTNLKINNQILQAVEYNMQLEQNLKNAEKT